MRIAKFIAGLGLLATSTLIVIWWVGSNEFLRYLLVQTIWILVWVFMITGVVISALCGARLLLDAWDNK